VVGGSEFDCFGEETDRIVVLLGSKSLVACIFERVDLVWVSYARRCRRRALTSAMLECEMVVAERNVRLPKLLIEESRRFANRNRSSG
jgi:hypothetical protein